MLTCVECCRTSFEDVFGEDSDCRVVERANAVWRWATVRAVALQSDDEFRVAEDGHIRVVGARDYLSLTLEFAQLCDHSAVHEVVIEIVLRLIDD